MENSKLIEIGAMQWLVLDDEIQSKYTNIGDGRPGDASELIAKVNTDKSLGLGFSDWRLPTISDLESLAGTTAQPKTDPNCGATFWSSSPSRKHKGVGVQTFFFWPKWSRRTWENKTDMHCVRLVRLQKQIK